MSKALLSSVCGLVATLAATAQPGSGLTGPSDPAGGLANEQRHFLQCLAYVYDPAHWISYHGSLYFTTTSEAQAQQLDRMKAARSRYQALTDRQKRHEMATKAVAASGVQGNWPQKMLLPYSETNENLTPTLAKEVRLVPTYKLLQKLGEGDVLIQDREGSVYFVMDFGRATDDAGCTNGLFVKEGEKTYTTRSGGKNTVEAFTSVGLNAAERAALQLVAVQFRKEAALVRPEVVSAPPSEEFEWLKARATDSNPHMQFLLAKAYLEGNGTRKDEKLGLEWMRRARANGSGQATSYLEAHKESQ